MIVDVSLEKFENEILQEYKNGVIIAIFYTSWCKSCTKLKQNLEDVIKDFDDRFIITTIDIENNTQAIEKYSIKNTPDIKIYKHNLLIEEFIGNRVRDEMLDTLSKHLINKKYIIIEDIKNLQKTSNETALIVANKYKEQLIDNSDFKLLYAKILVQANLKNEAIEILKMFVKTNKHYEIATNMLKSLQQNRLEQKKLKELSMMYNSVIECIANDEIYEAIHLLVQMIKKDQNYKDDLAKKTLYHIIEYFSIDETLKQNIKQII